MMVELSDCDGEVDQAVEEEPPAGITIAAKEKLANERESSSFLVALCLDSEDLVSPVSSQKQCFFCQYSLVHQMHTVEWRNTTCHIPLEN